MLTHFSLFTGIGGIDLAAEWAGFTTVGQCEWADYPTKVLEKHWPDVPRWRDIRSVTKDSFFKRTGLRTVDLVSGGFPCQPFSTAGKRKGKEDDRFLWPEMLRVVSEIWPTWVLGENVAGIVNMALDQVCADLESKGYEVQAFIIPACGVNAPHKRDRVFIVGHRPKQGDLFYTDAEDTECSDFGEGKVSIQKQSWLNGLCENVSNADSNRLQGGSSGQIPRFSEVSFESMRSNRGYPRRDYWEAEPNVGRVAHGIPSRVDRLKCLGNAVVPQQVYPVLKAIADIETSCDAE